jgi:hypothetical protein
MEMHEKKYKALKASGNSEVASMATAMLAQDPEGMVYDEYK